ncbi:MAG: hypothetical protein LAO51_15515 [Acidobacteriia bacterium]|nr:hypothetical protein [Terriglobia bacterium]
MSARSRSRFALSVISVVSVIIAIPAVAQVALSSAGQVVVNNSPPKPVLVINGDGQAIPVVGRIVDTPKQAFNRWDHLNFGNGERIAGLDIYTVPAGKQLVLTHASISMSPPVGQKPSFRIAVVLSGELLAAHDLAPVATGPLGAGGAPGWIGSGPLNIYVDAGGIVQCDSVRDTDTGAAFGFCNVSGYLVDAP